MERPTSQVHEARNAVLVGLGRHLSIQSTHPTGVLRRLLEVEASSTEDRVECHVAAFDSHDGGAGVEAAEEGFEYAQFRLVDKIALVDEEYVGELDLVDQQIGDRPLVVIVGADSERGQITERRDVVAETLGVDNGDHCVEQCPIAERGAVLIDECERRSDWHRLGDSRGLDQQIVEAVLGGEAGDLDEEVLAQSAADAPVCHLDQLFGRAIQAGAAATDQVCVNVDLAHVVDDHGHPLAFAVGQHMVEDGGLASAEEPREHGGRKLLHGNRNHSYSGEMSTSEAVVKVPVTVLTGFLGSGKTTLLNYLLTEQHGQRIAVIENEFGEIGIDDALVIDAEEEIFEMNNGCICCTVRGDLIRILGNLMARRDRFDRIVIETTGLADPAPVAQTFFVDDEMRSQLALDAIVTMVDARHILQHLDEVKPEGVENEALEQLAFADRVILNKTDLVTADELAEVERRIRSINSMAEIIPASFAKIDLDRILGVGAFDLARVLEFDPKFLEESEHQHDQSVTSVGLEIAGEVDPVKINDWLSWLLGEKGVDIFRMKGIVAIAGEDRRFVFQGVHMLFDGEPDRPWQPDEDRTNRMVFIGRNLDRAELTQRFTDCLVAAR